MGEKLRHLKFKSAFPDKGDWMVSENAGDGLIPDSGCKRWKGNLNLLLFAAQVPGVVAPATASLPNCHRF